MAYIPLSFASRKTIRPSETGPSYQPFLEHPDFERHFYIQCDASDIGSGGMLFQKDEGEGEHPIANFTQKLTPAQKNYLVTEGKCLAVVLATFITDHISLTWLMANRNLSGRLARWSLHLQAYDFQIEHRAGTRNIVPDTLLRYDLEAIEVNTKGMIELLQPSTPKNTSL